MHTQAYYTPDGSYIASVSRLEDELRLSCAATGDLVGAYKVSCDLQRVSPFLRGPRLSLASLILLCAFALAKDEG